MIKATGQTDDGRPFLMLGLSFRNLALLQQGKPILVRGEEVGMPCDVMLMAGETEGAIAAQLREAGVQGVPGKT